MNEQTPNNPTLPDGFENWSLEKKEEYLVGEQKQPEENLAQAQETEGDKNVKNFLGELDSLNSQIGTKNIPDVIEMPTAPAEPMEEAVVESEPAAPTEPQETEEVIVEEPQIIEENVPQWRQGEEWKKFVECRETSAESEAAFNKSGSDDAKSGLESNMSLYEKQRQIVAQKIVETLKAEAGENLTDEQDLELKGKINDILFEELARKENQAYKNTLKDHVGETPGNKVTEGLKKALNSKAVQWYLKQNKWVRLGVTTLLVTGVGYAAGTVAATGAAGYAAARVVRGAASFGGATIGTVIGERKKSWSLEELDRKEQEEITALKNAGGSPGEKSEALTAINEKYEKERKIIKFKKAALTIGLGAGAGVLSGLSEHLFSSGPKVTEAPAAKPNVPKPVEPVEPAAPVEKIFSDPKVLMHKVEAGDSPWKILEKTLENNEQFKNLTEAQKTYVLSGLVNKMLKNPEDYGLRSGGAIRVGDQTDFTKLFEDTKGVKSLLSKAEQTIIKGGPQEESIILNNQKISSWIKENPGVELTDDKVAEILSSKPKTEIVPEPEPESVPVPEAVPEPLPNPEPIPEGDIHKNETVLADDGREAVRQEIEAAKKRLAELENKTVRNPNLERSLASDTALSQGVEEAFRNEIDSIYGRRGLLGVGKIAGINTKEWGEMARLPASKVVEYYTGDSAKSGLPAEIVEKLSKSSRHADLMKQTAGLMERTNGAVKPFENENMEQFIKRLGGYVLKTHTQNLQKAA